MTPHNLVGLY